MHRAGTAAVWRAAGHVGADVRVMIVWLSRAARQEAGEPVYIVLRFSSDATACHPSADGGGEQPGTRDHAGPPSGPGGLDGEGRVYGWRTDRRQNAAGGAH